jgi:hypothetical protein
MSKISDHKFRFGKNGKPLAAFFKKRTLKEKRLFPFKFKLTNHVLGGTFPKEKRKADPKEVERLKTEIYVDMYYRLNKEHGIIKFVGINYG